MYTDSNKFYWVNIPELETIEGVKQEWGDVFNITNIDVDRTADAIMSPIELGTKVFDNKVIQPLHVTLNAIVKCRYWEAVWDKLLTMFNNRTYNFYDVYTKGELIDNLMLTKVSRVETVDKYDAVEVRLEFIQIVYATETALYLTYTNAADEQNNDTTDTGQKTPTTDTDKTEFEGLSPLEMMDLAKESYLKNGNAIDTFIRTGVDTSWVSRVWEALKGVGKELMK